MTKTLLTDLPDFKQIAHIYRHLYKTDIPMAEAYKIQAKWNDYYSQNPGEKK